MCHKEELCSEKSARKSASSLEIIINSTNYRATPSGFVDKLNLAMRGKMMLKKQALYLLLASIALVQCAGAYQFPINAAASRQLAANQQQQQQQHHLLIDHQRNNILPPARRLDEGSGGQENEAQQLRRLHQVVDTMAELLSEEEQQADKGNQQPAAIDMTRRPAAANNFPQQVASSSEKNAPEMIGEYEIKQALEELEKMQQQEGQAIESSQRPMVMTGPGQQQQQQQQQQKQQQAALESLIDELDEELNDDHFSQEADRMLRDGESSRVAEKSDESTDKSPGQAADRNQRAAPDNSMPSSTPSPQQPVNNATSSSKSALIMGSLDSMASDLGPALTKDFYTFHAEPGVAAGERIPSSDIDMQKDQPSAPSVSAAADQQKQESKPNSLVLGPSNDLETAAQMRSPMVRANLQPSFSQDSSTIRFDFNTKPQAIHNEHQLPRPLPLQANQNQDSFLRGFRPQNGPNLEDNQFPTSTLIPIVGSSDNFWRPTGDQRPDIDGSRDINQQYDRARGSQQQAFPPLPESRFQSLSPAGQFGQSALPSARQTQHVHFTGHSFIPSNGQSQFPPPQQLNPRDRPFSSTMAPLISVLSGSDTSIGNSVSWNPPANLNPPPQGRQQQQALGPQQQLPPQVFNQQFPSPTSTQVPSNTESIVPSFFSPPSNRGPPSPLFNNAFQPPPPRNLETVSEAPARRPPMQEQTFRPQPQSDPSFVTSTEFSNFPETTTLTNEDRFQQPTTTLNSAPQSSQGAQSERDAADSELRSSIRTLANNQRYFSPNDLIGPPASPAPITTTQSSMTNYYSEPSRNPRTSVPTTTTSTTTTTSASLPTTTLPSVAPATNPTNATAKKDDTVIYYYYYYDDNKNATVVAKNISSPTNAPAPATLDEAIEADGGIEDTPYMDDPAPISGIRTSSLKPAIPTTTMSTPTTSTSTPTTTSTTTTTAPYSFAPTSADTRSRSSQSSSGRAHAASDQSSSFAKSPQFDKSFDAKLTRQNQFDGDTSRIPAGTVNRMTSGHAKSESPVITFNPTPYYASSSTSSPKSGTRGQQAASHEFGSTSSRFQSTTEASRQLGGEATLNRAEAPINRQHVTSTSVGAKVQNDLIQNVLNGIPASSQQRYSTTASTPIASGSSHHARGPLSNASRYGTNNNLLLDPYGLDPTAPATIVHSSATNNSLSHKNWQSTSGVHQFNRKPSSFVTTENSVEAQSPRTPFGSTTTSTSTSRTTNQHFSSQRNSNLPAPAVTSPRATHQQVSTQVTQRVAPSNNAAAVTFTQSATRQFFPETNNALSTGNVERAPLDVSARVSTQSSRQTTLPELAPAKPARGSAHIANDLSDSKFVSTPDEGLLSEPPKRIINNGRPSSASPERSMGASEFTRAPIQHSSITPSSSTPTVAKQATMKERPLIPASMPVSSTQTSVSTSSSSVSSTQKSVTPLHASTMTSSSISSTMSQSTSMSPSSTPSTVAVSSHPQPAVSTETSVPQTNAPAQTTTSTTTSAPQETNIPVTEDTSSASTRKRFGNRNNRIQTRLNSLSSARSSTTTTTTTPSPAFSSTTRRATTSTTRKSRKQLFAGKRGFNQTPSTESSTIAVASSSNGSSNMSAPAAEIPASASSSPAPPAQASTAVRSRFGNSFTARSRLSTAGPSASAGVQSDPLGSTQRPSLFGSQRTSRPRLPIGRPSKVTSTTAAAATESSTEPGLGSTAETGQPMASSERASTEKSSIASESLEGSLPENVSSGSLEDESGERKESAASNETVSNEPATATSTTSAPAATSSTSASETVVGRNKPKVRPLFASRQRSTSLFGNRRGNTTST